MTRKPQNQGAIQRATVYIVLSALAFSFAGVVVRLLHIEMSTVALVFWRNVFSFGTLLAWFGVIGFPNLETNRLGIHCWRALFSYGALLTYFYALNKIPLANAVLLQSSAPIFIPILAFLVFQKLSDRFVWSGVLVGFVGVALIVLPRGVAMSLGEISGVLSGFFGALATLAVWSLSSTESATRQMFYFTLLTLILSSVLMPWLWETPALSDMPGLVALGVLTTLAQNFLALGCISAPADKVITWGYTSIVFSALLGFAIWGEAINLKTVVGIVLIVAGAHWTTRSSVSGGEQE